MDVGGELRRARTERKLSLGDVSARTKINQNILRAIEDNKFDRVPGGLFTRGYLRAFAREVHLDPEKIVVQYRAEFETPIVELPSAEKVMPRIPDYSLTADGIRDHRGFVGLAIVLLIGASYFGYARTRSSTPSPPVAAAPVATDAVEPAAPAPVPTPTTGTVEPSQTGPLKLAIATTGDCWVSATVDGKPAIARLMKAGDGWQFDVNDSAALRVGDPAAFGFTLNGIPGRVLGTAHNAVNLTFDRQNYKSVLLEKPL